MRRGNRNIVVIGTSSGGLEALDKLVGELPANLRAALFVVQHMDPQSTGSALEVRLAKHKSFHCQLAVDGERFRAGRIYICPPDCHLLIKGTHLLVRKGARENRYRPGIDPLFRSAAATHGPRVIGVLLTGMLDDGTMGLIAVKKCGGVTVVQDPSDAAYAEMPQNALNNAPVDHCVPLSEMGSLLEKLTNEVPAKRKSIPPEIQTEAEIAERVLSDVAQVSGLGDQVPYNCPNCGGVLWKVNMPKLLRYRCHTGHSFTAKSLLTSQNEKIEETLWVSLRMFEERKNLLNTMAGRESSVRTKRTYLDRAKETEVHIQRIRVMLQTNPPKVEP
jgi:two-component system chemotaxis response regulator CheB